MSGHSKWASIKHKKGAARRQARQDFHAPHQGIDGRGPHRRRRSRHEPAAADDHRRREGENMPAENIKRAIRRGTGEEPGVSYEEAQYQGYGPGGAAVIIDVLTDNKNRTVGELRHLLEKHGGNLAAANAVAWMFAQEGLHRRREDEGRRGKADGRGARRRRRRSAGRRRQLGSVQRARMRSRPCTTP